jgi:hypothetical protein
MTDETLTAAKCRAAVEHAAGSGRLLEREERPMNHPMNHIVRRDYNMARAAPAPDQTKLRLRLTPSVVREALFLGGDDLLDTLYDATPATLDPGQRCTSVGGSIRSKWLKAAAPTLARGA